MYGLESSREALLWRLEKDQLQGEQVTGVFLLRRVES